jgi:hypothetical protein
MTIFGGRLPQFFDNYDGQKMRLLVDAVEKTFAQINRIIQTKKFNMRVRRTTTQSIDSGSATVIQWVTEDWDNEGAYSVSTYRFLPGTSGYYDIKCQSVISAMDDGKYVVMVIRKNGAAEITGAKYYNTIGSANDILATVAGTIYLGSSDYIDVTIEHDHGSSRNIAASSTQNIFSAFRII